MNEVVKRRVVGGCVLALLAVVFGMLFFKGGTVPGVEADARSDLADVRTYAIEVPTVPEELPQDILAKGAPIGTLLPGPGQDKPTQKADQKPSKGEEPVQSKPKTAAKSASKSSATQEPAHRIPDVGWSVQVGSFASRDNANGLQERLKEKGYPAFIYRNTAENPPLFRVRVGPYMAENEAKSAADRLREDIKLDVRVVSNG